MTGRTVPKVLLRFAEIRMPRRDVFHFGDFTLDVKSDGCSAVPLVRLSPKAFDVLVALVREAGHLVTKNELLARVWPESFVEEGILTVHMSALRKALGDDTRPSRTSRPLRAQVSLRRAGRAGSHDDEDRR